ncbi:Tyrosyl-tRNA synthetase [Mycoplasmopsis gallinarum]|uniref:Tyrosine--tRNA ligase n=2 Tax=Mycoplasmopsis gallinarum TaxID=29557 RepID=A0A168RFE5_9BACT|nr:tyrosine--tRNA ligase [Mycoplasmopsis gallinarum]OAB48928.1 Tyrosyl-tRNA synthetase [Mycoplasmopsis gallinarum]
MTIIEELKERGILKQISNEEKLLNLNPEQTGIYVGFDPTAKSLHLGNYILMINLKRFQKYGYKTYALVGGATGMIGDPSFRDSERVLLDLNTVIDNKNRIKTQLSKMNFEVVDNYDFYINMNVLDFLRDAGKLINVASMLSKDSVTKRIERGLSFTEFTYQVIQGYDFLTLYKNNNVCIQMGGSDQWGNIVAGLDMIDKVYANKHNAIGLTLDLLTDENGNKIGKSTGGGSLWLDKELSSPYNMYQYLLNQPDSIVKKLLMWLTFLDVSKINSIIEEHQQNPKAHLAQKILASEVIKDIFGSEEVKKAEWITSILFNKNFDFNKLNISEIAEISNYLPICEISENENIINTLIENKFILSKREAREFIQTNALKIDNELVNEETLYHPKQFEGKYAIFKKGKKQTIILKTK